MSMAMVLLVIQDISDVMSDVRTLMVLCALLSAFRLYTYLSKHWTSFGLLMPPTNWIVSPKDAKQAKPSYLQLGSTGIDTLTTGTWHMSRSYLSYASRLKYGFTQYCVIQIH